jgi:cytochrome c oxidase assembly protein subunit 15
VPRRIRNSAIVLLVLVLVQIYLGALVAGLRAGLVYNTWPLIDGAFVPNAADLFFNAPAWRNVFENALTVQFDHRMMAYMIWVLVAIHLADVARNRPASALGGALTLFAAVSIQAMLGIITLLYQAPLALALTHQAMAMVTLTVAVTHAARLASSRAERSPFAAAVSAHAPR